MSTTLTTKFYCPACDSLTTSHICTSCNDYTLTYDEAIAEGWMICVCPDCNA